MRFTFFFFFKKKVNDEEQLRDFIAVDKCDSGRKSIRRTTQGMCVCECVSANVCVCVCFVCPLFLSLCLSLSGKATGLSSTNRNT